MCGYGVGAHRDGDVTQNQKFHQLWNTIVEKNSQLWYAIVDGPILIHQLWNTIVENVSKLWCSIVDGILIVVTISVTRR